MSDKPKTSKPATSAPRKLQSTTDMTEAQKRFVAEYAATRNASEAARRAGYSEERGRVLLRRPHVVAMLKEQGVEIHYGANPPGQRRMAPGRYTPRRPRPLTALQQRFVEEYLIDSNGTKAAIRAGLRSRNPRDAGAKMLARKPVAAALEQERERSMERTRITRDRVLLEYARIAFAEIGDIADWDEDAFVMKPKDEIAKDDRAAVAEIKAKRGKHGPRAQIRMHSKLGALDALGKHLGLWGKRTAMDTLEDQCKVNGRDAREVLRERFFKVMRAPQGQLIATALGVTAPASDEKKDAKKDD